MGDELIHGTARAAMLCLAAVLSLRAWGGQTHTREARWCWSLGLLSHVAHLAAAFHFAHQWSHDEAYLHTAQRTADAIGWHWGGGVFVNYAFTLVWAGDCLWWWFDPHGYLTRSARIGTALYGFMIFMAFNATVVFGRGATVWLGLAGSLLLSALAWHRRAQHSHPTAAR